MTKQKVRAAYRSLRRVGSEADKDALLAHLAQQETKPGLAMRAGIWFERVWPSLFGSRASFKVPALGFAAALVLVVSVFMSVQRGGPINEVPEIEDLEFAGGSAMVFEQQNEHTTLIWLSEVEEETIEDSAEPDTLHEEIVEPAVEPTNTEVEKI